MNVMVDNTRSMLKPMGWVAIYYGLDPAKWNEFYNNIEKLDPRDIDTLYETVLMLSQEEWRPVWDVWKLPRLQSPETVHEIWMHFRAFGIKDRDEQKLLSAVLPPFKKILKKVMNQWSLQQNSEASC